MSRPHNNSLERTQPQRDFMYDGAVLRRSARGRWAAGRWLLANSTQATRLLASLPATRLPLSRARSISAVARLAACPMYNACAPLRR